MIRTVKRDAPAKINLCLDVIRRRQDGYHDVATVMQTVALFDTLTVKFVDKPNYLKVISNAQYLPSDCRNLAYKGAKAVIDMFGLSGGVFIDIQKRIPVAAGLAGGSADCAAAMLAAVEVYGLGGDACGRLEAEAARIGADVAFCLKGGAALAKGIGEELTPLPNMPECHILIAKPNFSVSTGAVFKELDLGRVTERPDIEAMISAMREGSLNGICENAVNVLESVTAERHPIIAELKAFMRGRGALAAVMSGSGPSVIGVYGERRAADEAAKRLRAEFPIVREVFVTGLYNP